MAETESKSSDVSGQESNIPADYYENAVFVSYAWGGESERMVDDLEQAFAEHDIRIVRDKKDLGYKGSIESFEQRIGHGQCVILVISDKYLRSEHCMYELVEVDKNQSLRERVFPVVLADARIYKAMDRLNYIKYWDEQIEQLNLAIKEVNVMTNLPGIMANLDKYALIRASFDHLTDLLSDMNTLTPELHAANGYSTLISAVERTMAIKQSDNINAQPDEISNSRYGHLPTPFIYGRPVQPDEFINREDELRSVFNRLRNGESTAIVGEPHIGKTSFLIQITDKKTQMSYLGENARSLVVSHFNFHYIKNDFTPTLFWEMALRPLRKLSYRDGLALRLEELGRSGYASESLDEFFSYFDEQGQQLILILDEFDLLLNHPKFQEFAFYATLRAVTQYRSCSQILASRSSLTELQKRVDKLPFSGGSPVFNTLTELRLKPFDDKNVEAILTRAGDAFSPKEKLIIGFTAGRHPYLVQTMAANLLEMPGNTRRQFAIEQFCNSAHSHFDDLWCTLPDRERTTLIILGLVECAKCKSGQKFNYSEIQSLANLGAGLHILRDLGLAERLSHGQQTYRKCLIWQEEQWTLGTQALVCWVYKVVVAGTYPLPSYDEWLRNEGYISLLKPEQWKELVDRVRSAVGPRICNMELLIEKMFSQKNGVGEDAAAS